MTTVYVIRHAEAEGNRYRRIHGQYDSLVTARGWEQIRALSDRFSEVHVDAVYSSDLTRTRMTASAIYKTHDLKLITDVRLREVNMGVWEDKPWAEVERIEPEQLYCFNYDLENWTTQGSENVYELRSRIKNAIIEIASKHDGQTIAIVTHGCAIRSFIAEIKGIPPARTGEVPYCDNTAVTTLHVEDNNIVIIDEGDATHLSPDLSTLGRQRWWKNKTSRDNNNIWYRRMDIKSDTDLYFTCSDDTPPAPQIRRPGSFSEVGSIVYIAMCGDEPSGVLELCPKIDEDRKIGWIALFNMLPEYRKQGMSIQLIGQATSVYRKMGRTHIRIAVPQVNTDAIRYFYNAGFYEPECKDIPAYTVLELKIALDYY